MVGLPPLVNGEIIALPFAVGCGFAGGGLRELCPKEAIWHFSPFVFTGLHRRAWDMLRRFQVDWQVVLLLAPVGLELLRQALGAAVERAQSPVLSRPAGRRSGGLWTLLLVLLATVLCVATPIKIWNNARIEHRLAGAGEAAARGEDRGARQPDQPALPVQHAGIDLLARSARSPKPRAC